jgi:hypothetical protein
MGTMPQLRRNWKIPASSHVEMQDRFTLSQVLPLQKQQDRDYAALSMVETTVTPSELRAPQSFPHRSSHAQR